MTDRYTSEDFDEAIECATEAGKLGDHYFYDSIAFTALRIASRVQRVGVIEAAYMAGLHDPHRDIPDTIRSALMDEDKPA